MIQAILEYLKPEENLFLKISIQIFAPQTLLLKYPLSQFSLIVKNNLDSFSSVLKDRSSSQHRVSQQLIWRKRWRKFAANAKVWRTY